jgi:hypothetical protein
MTWKTTAILATLILSGVGIAYAEESTIQVPFDYHGLSCWLESETTYQCTWQGEIEPVTIEELESFKDSISTEVYEKELARLTAPIVVEVAPELTKDEKTIQKLELKLENGIMKTPDAVLLQMLRDLDECQQGLDNSSAIQTERTFVISQYDHLEVFNVQMTGQLGELVMAIEECKAQQVLEHQILTVAYKHFEDANRAGNFIHLEALKGVSAIPYEQYTKSDFKVDIRGICASNAHHQQYKEQMGCEPIKYDGFTYPEGNGFISYHSPILEEYTFFMQDYGNRQATEKDKLIQANIAEPIVKELIEDNLFYQNKINRE